MPSPIAHAATAYLLYETFRSHMPEEASSYVGPLPRLLITTVGLSMLADLDFLPGTTASETIYVSNHAIHRYIQRVHSIT